MASCSTYDMAIQLEVEVSRMLSENSVGITLFFIQFNHMRKRWDVKLIHNCGFEYVISNYNLNVLISDLNRYINPELED